jgi:hypothetical protein
MKTENSLFIIYPYIHMDEWVFDDPSRNLDKEPFVAGADTLLDIISGRDTDDNVTSCKLFFSSGRFPSAEYRIELLGPDEYNSGNYYAFTPLDGGEQIMKLWLCPALFKYFEEAPKEIYVAAK